MRREITTNLDAMELVHQFGYLKMKKIIYHLIRTQKYLTMVCRD
jgi:hypothetical protein